MSDKIFAICKFPEENDKFSEVPLSWVTENEKDKDKSQCRWPNIKDMKVVRSFIYDHTEPEDSWQTLICKIMSYSNERDLKKKLRKAQYTSDLDSPVKSKNKKTQNVNIAKPKTASNSKTLKSATAGLYYEILK